MAKSSTMLWGYHPVGEALRARRRKITKLLLVQDQRGRRDRLARMAEDAGIEVAWVREQQLTQMVGHDRHQGVAAQSDGYPYATLDQILALDPKAPFILALDQIVDPQNLGAMARTAHCAGVHGMIIVKDRAAAPSAAASKASAGALEHMRLVRVTNLVAVLKKLKAEGFWIAGADHHGNNSLFDVNLTGPLVLVIGGEEKGVRPLVRQQCDFTMAIPQVGTIGSLNASVAAAIVIYEAFRQRTK